MTLWLDKLLSRRKFLSVSALSAMAAGCTRFIDLKSETSTIPDKKNHPVVVVGAGLGGLTAAAYLARMGFPVTVVEQHHIPGGYATSFGRAGGRFNFDVSLHQTAARNSIVQNILEELDLFDNVEPVGVPELCRVVTPDYDITLPQADPAGCVEALAEFFPGEREGIRSFIDRMIAVSKSVRTIPEKMGLKTYLTFRSKHRVLWDIRRLTLAQMLEQHVQDPKLKSLLSVFWSYYGLPPSKLSAFYYALANGEYINHGGYYYKNRSQALSDALTQMIAANGGRVMLSEDVEGILVEKGSVSGVRIQSGEILPARIVVSNASAPTTFKKLLPSDAVPSKYMAKLDKYRPSISSFIVWLGLNQEISNIIPHYETFLTPGYDPEAEYEAAVRADARGASLAVSVYDNLYPGYSKPGTSTLMLMFCCGYEPWKKFEADYEAGRKNAYEQEKERLARILIERTEERLIPGLSDMIEVKVTASPLTNRYFTKNPGGAIYGFEQSMDNAFLKRIENRTPIDGLYLAGAWGFPGGGYTGVQKSGRIAVLNILD